MMQQRHKRRRLCSDVPDLYKTTTEQSFADRVKSWDEMSSPAHGPWSGDNNRVSVRLREAVRVEPAARQSATHKTDIAPVGDKTLLELADAFSHVGIELHQSILRDIKEAYNLVSSNITQFVYQVKKLVQNGEDIYDCISEPLSATVCEGNSLDAATIASHLLGLQCKATVCESELTTLQTKWKECAQAESALRCELDVLATMSESFAPPGDMDLDAFQAEVEELEVEKICKVEKVEAAYRDKIQEETLLVMQSIMAD